MRLTTAAAEPAADLWAGGGPRSYRWALNFQYRRILSSNEVKMGMALNGCTPKKLGGSETLVGRQHGGNETSFKNHFMMMTLAKDLPKINPLDDGVKVRARCLSLIKTFVVVGSDAELEHDQERADLSVRRGGCESRVAGHLCPPNSRGATARPADSAGRHHQCL